jgi:3-oxoacyl-[acyl-carrier-protein] synthase-3
MAWFFKDSGYLLSDLDAIIPHQASKTGNAVFSQLYDLEPGVIKSNLADRGNCIAASIPLALMEAIAIGEIKRGDVCLISGTSAGFSIGGVLFKY